MDHSRTLKILANAAKEFTYENREINEDNHIPDTVFPTQENIVDNLLILNIPEVTDSIIFQNDIIPPFSGNSLENDTIDKDCTFQMSINNDVDGMLHTVDQNEFHTSTLIQCNEIFHNTKQLPELNELEDVGDVDKINKDKNNHSGDSNFIDEEHNDPTFNPGIEEIDNNDEASSHVQTKRRRRKRHLVNKQTWNESINKLNREKGEEYIGKKKVGDIWIHTKKPERVIKPRCNCKYSSMKCKKGNNAIQCYKILEEDRNQIFLSFWKYMNWPQRKTFVNGSIVNENTRRPRNRINENQSRRQFSSQYYLKKGESRIRVCKKMFLNTIGMGERMINIWKYSEFNTSRTNKMEDTETERENIEKSNSTTRENMKKSLRDFFNNLPKLESHYCRSSSQKLYLEPNWKSKAEMYKFYKNVWCKEDNIAHLSIAVFNHIFHELNLSLFTPKKDECDKCVSHRTGNLSDDLFSNHQAKKKEAREANEADKNANHKVFCVDLQAVLLSPKANTSSLYFKTKLCVHNFTIYDMKTKDGYCFIWHESAGSVTANDFASILCSFIRDQVIGKMETDESIIIWSDGCTSQNRNSILANAFINMALKYGVTIYQKFLEKGHTQMEADSMHSTIERKLHNTNINVPADYVGVCLHARSNPRPYKVKYLDYKFFKNFSNLKFLNSIRPGRKTGDPVVTDIRALKYTPEGSVFYKLRHSEDYSELMYRTINKTTPCTFEELPQLYSVPIPIKKEKYDHLQFLKRSLLQDFHQFYDNLSFKN